MKKIILGTILGLTSIGLFGCENQNKTDGDIVISHVKGEAHVTSNVEKAVVFDMGVLDTIDKLNVNVELALPVSSVPEYLSEYQNAYNAGGIKEPDMEAIVNFGADVIFISGRQESYYEELNKIAPTIYVELNASTYMEDFSKNTLNIGKVFNKEEEAKNFINKYDNKIAEIKTLTNASNEKGLILLTNDKSISAYGSGSRFGIIHDVLEVKRADETIEVSTHGQKVNYEYISQVNPDMLFVVDRTKITGTGDDALTVLDNDLVKKTNAYLNNKIFLLDAEMWYLSAGGVKSLGVMLDEIHSAFK